MPVSKSERRIIAIGYAAFLLTLIWGVIAFLSHDELSGVFTNGKSENCASFISIEFNGDRFFSTINVPLDSGGAALEHIADRIEQTEDGGYFIRISQRGTFHITNSGYEENIIKIFPCEGIQYNRFSQSRNGITIAQTYLSRVPNGS